MQVKHPDIAVFGFTRYASGESYVLGNRAGGVIASQTADNADLVNPAAARATG